MSIFLFLGTSAHLPIPREGCSCPQCASRDPKDHRTRSCVLIDNITLIDCGSDIINQLKRQKIDPKSIKQVLLTHNHNDAAGGIDTIKTANPSVQIYNPDDKPVHINSDLIIDRIFMPHGNAKNVAMVIKGCHSREGGNPIFYNPDTHNLASAIKTLKKVGIAILDGSGWQRVFPSHQPMIDIIRLTKPLKNLQKIYFIHNGHTRLPHSDMVKLVRQHGDNRFDLAYDGLELSL